MNKFLALGWHIDNIAVHLLTIHCYQQQTAAHEQHSLYTWRTLTVAVQWKRANKYCSECRLPIHSQNQLNRLPGSRERDQWKYVNIKKLFSPSDSTTSVPNAWHSNCAVGTNGYNAGSALSKQLDCYSCVRKTQLFTHLLQTGWNLTRRRSDHMARNTNLCLHPGNGVYIENPHNVAFLRSLHMLMNWQVGSLRERWGERNLCFQGPV